MSSVEAVRNAQAAKMAAEAKARQDIANCKEEANSKVFETVKAKNDTIKVANAKIKAVKKSQQIAWSSLIATLFFCLMAYPVFLEDAWEFISTPIAWTLDNLSTYAKWMATPYYSKYINGMEKHYLFSAGSAWILRLITPMLIIAVAIGSGYGIYQIWCYYKKRWCNLSLRVLLVTFAGTIILGEKISRWLNFNLLTLDLLIQLIYLGTLLYFDEYYDSHNKSEIWKKIQAT